MNTVAKPLLYAVLGVLLPFVAAKAIEPLLVNGNTTVKLIGNGITIIVIFVAVRCLQKAMLALPKHQTPS